MTQKIGLEVSPLSPFLQKYDSPCHTDDRMKISSAYKNMGFFDSALLYSFRKLRSFLRMTKREAEKATIEKQ